MHNGGCKSHSMLLRTPFQGKSVVRKSVHCPQLPVLQDLPQLSVKVTFSLGCSQLITEDSEVARAGLLLSDEALHP